MLEQFIENLSAAAFCCGPGTRRKLVKVDEAVIVRRGWR